MALIKPIAVGGLNVTNATLNTVSPVNISSGHVVCVSVWHSASSGTNTTDITISGTQGTDYEILLNDNTSQPVTGNVSTQSFKGMVIKAKNDITIQATHSAPEGTMTRGGILIYDLS